MITSVRSAMLAGFDLVKPSIGSENRQRRLCRVVFFLVFSGLASLSHAQTLFFNDGPDADQTLPFSQAVRVNDLLFVSGQVGTDQSGALVDGGIGPESHQVMRNIRDIIHRRGLQMSDVVKCTVFLADVAQWGDFNKVYTSYFSRPYPARSALGANGLALGAALEVECIAAYPPTSK